MTRIISIVGGMQPSAPTIGTATAGDTTASVAFTASSYIGKGTITYTATSSPGGLTATGASSPLTVTGLTNGTAYTFTVVGNTNYGVASVASAASNSITPASQSSYDSISTVTVGGGGTSTITFSSIPSTYTHLQIRALYKGASGVGDTNFRFNSDTGNNYTRHYLFANGIPPVNSGGSGNNNQGYIGYVPSTTQFEAAVIDIVDYKNTSRYKTVKSLVGSELNGGSGIVMFTSSAWLNTAAITDISFTHGSGTFSEYTQFALYGIKGA
jgi:hypothetical protein